MEPRVIRAKWKDETTANGDYKTIYHLQGGPVPSLLHVNRESRFEVLKLYNVVYSHTPLTGKIFREDFIYVNFSIDTIYVTRIIDTVGFQSWIRRLCSKHQGDAQPQLRYLAFDSEKFNNLFRYSSISEKSRTRLIQKCLYGKSDARVHHLGS